MGEVQFRRPVTPRQSLEAWVNDSPDKNHRLSLTPMATASSPRNSFGGNISSLSSRNSSLSRSQSKASLRSLLSRGRSASVASQRPDTSTSRGRPAGGSGKHFRHSSVTLARAESPHLSRIGSRLDSYRPTQVTHAAHIERTRSKQRTARRRSSPSWDPPPLFQAYNQSLKHAILDTSCLPTDVILRKSPFRDGWTSDELAKTDPTDTQGVGARLKKAKGNKHARKLSASISSSGWTKHLFVLIESEHLLQYAGSGHHDRLPEKMMRLTKETVAFASDAIPGRHWVLQVSQAAQKDSGTASESSKGILSRIGMQSSESRRTTQNILMVFDNAEDLDCWLTTIRREVAALGGRQYDPERPTDMEAGYSGLSTPVQRTSVENDSFQFPSNKFAAHHHDLSPVKSELLEQERNPVDDQMRHFRFWDCETASRKASKDSSTFTSTDLDWLRDFKESDSAKTSISTSLHGQSPSSSPGCATFALRPIPFVTSANASVVLGTQMGVAQMEEPLVNEPQSPTFLCHALDANDIEEVTVKATHSDPRSSTRKLSIVTPNFSVPISSDRFSLFGSPERLNANTNFFSTAATLSVSEDDLHENESAEDYRSSRRPISSIAPLPTPEALMNPTGNRARIVQCPSIEKPLPLQPLPVHNHLTSAFLNYDYRSSFGLNATEIPSRFTLPKQAMPFPSTPFPPVEKELPALQRSTSSQGVSTIYGSGAASALASSAAPHLRGRRQQRPLSLSGFPEPPSRSRPNTALPATTYAMDPPTQVKSLWLSNKTSPPVLIEPGASARANTRLGRILDAKDMGRLGVNAPSGPPPTCPLPATPSPSKRHFGPLPKLNSSSNPNRRRAFSAI